MRYVAYLVISSGIISSEVRANKLHDAVCQGDITVVDDLILYNPYLAAEHDENGFLPIDYVRDIKDPNVQWRISVTLMGVADISRLAKNAMSNRDNKMDKGGGVGALDEGERLQREASRALNDFYYGRPTVIEECDEEWGNISDDGYEASGSEEDEWCASSSGGDYDLRRYNHSSDDELP